jgi:protein dithiol oxidoreductase (disulfide-forming)
MKKLLMGLVAIAIVSVVISTVGMLRHSSHGGIAHRASVARISVHNAGASATEKSTGMAEESDTADVPSGFSPIAAAVAATTPSVAAPIPSRWVDGKNYSTLVPAQPTSAAPDKIEVVEVFWYGCPHCFALDPSLETWRNKNKAPYVEFTRVPVMWGPVHKAHARLFYTIVALGKYEQLHTLVFREIHVKNNVLVSKSGDDKETEQLQKKFLMDNGVSAADFDKTYRSFSVESKLQRAEELGKRYKVTGVPFFVVNGKYTADVGTAGGEAQLITLIDDLAAAEHKH